MDMREMPERDWYTKQTSSGIGHVFRPSPQCTVHGQKGLLLSPVLQNPSLVLPRSHFSSASRVHHDNKSLNGPSLSNTALSRAVPHWTINFLCQLSEKVRNSNAVRMVPPPCSEMWDSYRVPTDPFPQHSGTLLARYRQRERDQFPLVEVLCLSTAQTDYKHFSTSEQSFATGFGVVTTNNSQSQKEGRTYSCMPVHKAPPTVSCYPRLSCPLKPLPHGGKTSLYRDSYTAAALPPSTTYSLSIPEWSGVKTSNSRGLILDIVELPQIYSTENKRYGGNNTVVL